MQIKNIVGTALGRKLLTRVLDEAFSRLENADSIEIAVVLTHKNASKLYQILGFEEYRQAPTAVVKDGFEHSELHLKISRQFGRKQFKLQAFFSRRGAKPQRFMSASPFFF